jgi:predicted O-linked N-acetylglucosamine transferase (SPINDLY family)
MAHIKFAEMFEAPLRPRVKMAGTNATTTNALKNNSLIEQALQSDGVLDKLKISAISNSPTSADAPIAKQRPLRIGYVSPDFKQHSVAHFIEPVLAAHDKSKFEVFCYSNNLMTDEVTQRIQSACAHWRVIADQSDEVVAKQIRDDGIDILVDLAGHTPQNRLLVFARKPAPVQATWIGYPNTTGLTTMDYRITDAFADPVGDSDRFHTEKLIRLPECFSCFEAPRESPQVCALPALATGHITFGSFNNPLKFTPAVIEQWLHILKRVPNSRLVLKYQGLDSAFMSALLRAQFGAHGIAPQRLDILGKDVSQFDHMNRYNQIDIGLDPFPYNGTTTTCDALWMGVPVITLAGRSHVGRVGVSQLTNIGLPELIGHNEDDYVDIAVALANDLPRLAALRSGLRERLKASPLMDAPRLTRNLEAVYREMWKNHISNTT